MLAVGCPLARMGTTLQPLDSSAHSTAVAWKVAGSGSINCLEHFISCMDKQLQIHPLFRSQVSLHILRSSVLTWCIDRALWSGEGVARLLEVRAETEFAEA